MSSITHLVLMMAGLIVLFIVMCIRNEERARRISGVSEGEPTEDEKKTQEFIEKVEKFKKNTSEEGQRKHEELLLTIENHNEMNDAVKFTQDLINKGL